MILLLILELVSIETMVEPDRCYPQQPVTVVLRIRYDEAELRQHGVQLFAQELDLPVRVEAPWLDGIEGAALREPERVAGPSMAVNDSIVAARRIDGGVELRRVFRPAAPGELVIPSARLRYATASKFREDFVQGRIPIDREDFTVESAAKTVRVLPLPAAGRPPHFGGAVGRFVLRAATTVREARPMESFPLELHIEGSGNLHTFPPPRLALEGLHVYGRTDHGGTPRRITYDVAAIDASLAAIPPIELHYFDPAARAYRTARTEPIPIHVIGPAPAEEPTRPWWLIGLAVAVVAVALIRLRRRREPDAFEKAAHAFRAGGSFAEYLAALLGCPEAAVISPDLGARLERIGVAPEAAARAAALIERRIAARYGGTGADDGFEAAYRADALGIVEAISASRRGAPGS